MTKVSVATDGAGRFGLEYAPLCNRHSNVLPEITGFRVTSPPWGFVSPPYSTKVSPSSIICPGSKFITTWLSPRYNSIVARLYVASLAILHLLCWISM